MKTKSAILLLATFIIGCSPDQPSTAKAPDELPADHIVIRGSNTVGEELAPKLIAAYRGEHKNIAFDLESKGTSYGFGALMGGYCDIAGASRTPNNDELEVAQFHNVELNDYVIGAYAVEVRINPKNPVFNLSHDQVRDIFTGAIRNWKDVSGPDAPIHLYIRDPISGTYLGFKELAMDNKPYAADPKLFTTFTNDTGIMDAVAKDPNGIGYTGIYNTKGLATKVVPIDGLQPDPETINSGRYPYARKLHLFTNKANERSQAMDFIHFVQSTKGQDILTQVGDVPHS